MSDTLQVASYLEYEQAEVDAEEMWECEACWRMFPEDQVTEYCTFSGSYLEPPEYATICNECDDAATAAAEAWEEARREDAWEYARYQYEELK